MKALKKRQQKGSVEAYACACIAAACGCSCTCICMCATLDRTATIRSGGSFNGYRQTNQRNALNYDIVNSQAA